MSTIFAFGVVCSLFGPALWIWEFQTQLSVGILFSLGVLGAIQALQVFVLLAFERSKGRIPPGGPPVLEWSNLDRMYLLSNRICATIFIYHCYQYVMTLSASEHQGTFFNAVIVIPLMFVVYDLPYSFFHRLLHVPALYPLIHKHHHAEVTPWRGHDDAVNTHPLEYIIGQYLHLWVPMLLNQCVVAFHPATFVVFMALAGILASLSHTRYDVDLCFYKPRDHDMHHRMFRVNYGQYVHCWDYLFGTYTAWETPTASQTEKVMSKVRPPGVDDADFYAAIRKWERQAKLVADAPYMTEQACANTMKRFATIRDAPKVAAVTGGNGFVGQALVRMLLERGSEKVLSIDVREGKTKIAVPPLSSLLTLNMDITAGSEDMTKVLQEHKVCVVFHTAALVGPYHPKPLYEKVNYHGTLNVIKACRAAGVQKLVMTSSPSTLLSEQGVNGLGIDDIEVPTAFLDEYARTKRLADRAVIEANSQTLFTTVLMPHQVYGEDDELFYPNVLKAARTGKLRIMGSGHNVISFTHVQNVAHAHICAAAALTSEVAPPAANSYIVTDGPARYLWDEIDKGIVEDGNMSIWCKSRAPTWLLMMVARVGIVINHFTSMLGSKVPLTPYVVRAMTMPRYFSITKTIRDLHYLPIKSFDASWKAMAVHQSQKLARK